MRKLVTFIFIAILISLNLNFIKGSYQSYQKLSEINEEQEKVKDLELKNTELKQELSDRDSIYFIEKEARNRLGFSKPGESTIVLESEIDQASSGRVEEQKSNLQKWLELVRY